jgi:DNA replication protein DnaC
MLRLASVLQHTAPRFATRFRWAVEERNRTELAALKAENPTAYAALASQLRSSAAGQQNLSDEQRTAAAGLARQRRAAYLLQSKARVTDAMRAAITAGSLKPTESVLAVQQWLANRATPWLILSGAPDSGKSVAAAAALADHRGHWCSANEVVHAFAGMFGEALVAQQRAKEAELLVIDELGGEDDPGRMGSALLQLLNARNSAASTPVIATTNLTFDVLAMRYTNDRVRSRFSELVSWVPISPANLRPALPQLFTLKGAV